MGSARILHVLPHRGGGAEAYLEQIEGLGGFRFERFELTRRGRVQEVPFGVLRLWRRLDAADLLHVHGDSASISCLPLLRRRPTVITLHGSHLIRRRGAAVRPAMRRVLDRAAAVIATSESELELAAGIAAPGDAARVELVHNGIAGATTSEDEREDARAELGLPADAVACLFLGELSDRKQPLELAEALNRVHARNRSVLGLVAGEGPLRTALERQAGEGVRVLGRRDDPRRLLAACDVFVLPSRWEGLSYAALEAMAAGRAVVVSDGPGNPEAVGEAGLSFPVGDVAALADRIERLTDGELRAELGRRAAERVRERFSASAMREATARIYERALGSAPG